MATGTEAPVTTEVTPLEESRVRVSVEVGASELDRRMLETARRLGQSMRIPGFRKGKVPPPIVIQQVGREVVLDETVRGQLGRWYLDALDASDIHPVGEPDLDLGDLPAEGSALTFSFEIGVRPEAQLGKYKGIDVPRREAVADDAKVDEQIDELRERMARLEAEDRAAENGDFVVVDYKGFVDGDAFEGGEGRDQLIELGSGSLIPGFEEELISGKAGEERTIEVKFPDDYQAEHLAGKPATFEITFKEVKVKKLPDLDDDFASDAAGFDSLAELREDLAEKLRATEEEAVEREFREAALDAATANATVEVPEALVEARAAELLDRMMHSLSHQGINKETYLQITGRTEEELVAEAKPDAEQGLRREAVVTAIVEAEGLEPSDADVLDALTAAAARENVSPEKLRDRLEKNGRLDELKEDLAQRMAIDLVVEHAKAVPAPPAEEPAAD